LTRGCRDRRTRGFSTLEALFALAIVALALLLGLGLLAQQRHVLERLGARRVADRVIEETLEGLRSGAIPLPAPGTARSLPPLPEDPQSSQDLPGLEVRVRVDLAEPPADLYHVWVVARYEVAGQPTARSVETAIWRPGLVKGSP